MLHLARPRPSALKISWQPPRAAISNIAPLVSPISASSSYSTSTPIVLPQSVWSPNTPSPLSMHAIRSPGPPRTPLSPINPFLVAPRKTTMFDPHVLFPLAAPLLPASPLSVFDSVVSPTSSGFIACAPTPKSLQTKEPLLSPISPLSPRFMFPRAPPCVPNSKGQRRASAWDMNEKKMSVVSVLSLGNENLTVGMGLYRWLALRKWKLVARKEEKEKSWLNVKWRKLLHRDDATNESQEQGKPVLCLML